MKRSTTRIVLSGFMGTGKSTIAPLIADKLGWDWIDLDDQITQETSIPPAEHIRQSGEPHFRQIEKTTFLSLLRRSKPCVISTGGGALMDEESRHSALASSLLITLEASPETILARTHGSDRPLLQGAHPLICIQELLAKRQSIYRQAHLRISTENTNPHSVAERIIHHLHDVFVFVDLGDRSYSVQITDSLASSLTHLVHSINPTSLFLITDSRVNALWGKSFLQSCVDENLSFQHVIVLPEGEINKQLSTMQQIYQPLIDQNADRKSILVALGGGVVSDMTGFAAATWMRGVRWISIPTTTLAMVDASVGGKTAVDLGNAKNIVGAFHQPSGVLVDSKFVSTESIRAYRSGLAEVVKIACMADVHLFETLERQADALSTRSSSEFVSILKRAVELKSAIVSRDEHEQKERILLNFGHTLGHALEAHGNYSRLTHGEAVSLGMVGMLGVCVHHGWTTRADVFRVISLLNRLGLPTDIANEPIDEVLALIAHDKKRQSTAIRIATMAQLGTGIVHSMDRIELMERFREGHFIGLKDE